MRNVFKYSFFALLLQAVTAPVWAALTIDITEGVDSALPIAIIPFAGEELTKQPFQMNDVISMDLRRSGRFAPLSPGDLIERPVDAGHITYSLWKNKGVDYVVVGRIMAPAPGQFTVQFFLVDVLKATQLATKVFQANATDIRRIAHMISDAIYEAITGQRGAFDTHLAYVTITRYDGKEFYRLAVSDFDGYNERIVFESRSPIFSPSWSPDGSRLAYVTIKNSNAELFVQNIYTKSIQKVSAFPGLNNAPAWSPDGRRLALTLSKDGNAEIYVMDLETQALQRITNTFAIDTEAAWMPDGSALIFTSDRGGKPQLYRVTLNGNGTPGVAKRLTFDGDYNAKASVAPDGKRIAFVHGSAGQFRIAVLDLETDQLKVLTDTRLDESPSFAPNGSMIIYETEERNRGVLVITSADGRVKQRLSFQSGDVRQPAWSPFKRN